MGVSVANRCTLSSHTTARRGSIRNWLIWPGGVPTIAHQTAGRDELTQRVNSSSGGSGGAPFGDATGGKAGGAGSAFGAGMFLQGSGTLTFTPGAGQTQFISDSIADQTGSGGTGNNAGSWGLVLNGAGTLLLLGVHPTAMHYSGGTAIASGTLELGFGGSVAGNVTFMGAGATLRFDQGISQIGGDIVRAAAGDDIDLRFQTFASGDHAVWQQTAGETGTLTLLDGSGAVWRTLISWGGIRHRNLSRRATAREARPSPCSSRRTQARRATRPPT